MFGLSENTYQIICSILSNFTEIEKAIIYGSRAKGNYRIGSDIDLAIIGDELTFDIVINLLTEAFGDNLVVEDRESVDFMDEPGFPEDLIDSMMEAVRTQRAAKNLTAMRENGRVLVFNK